MRTARGITGWGAAAVAAVLVATASPAAALPIDETVPPTAETAAPTETAAPEPTAAVDAPAPEQSETPDAAPGRLAVPAPDRAERAAIAAEGVGDLTLTVFEDRYQDGIFDTSKVGRQGQSDLNRSLSTTPYLVASNGTRYTASRLGADWFFDDVPAGTAKVYVEDSAVPAHAMLFDASNPGKLQKLAPVDGSSSSLAEGSVTIAEAANTTQTVGLSGLRAVADVKLADGTPVPGVSLELGANGQWLPATEYSFQPGSYEHLDNGYVFLLPGEFGVRVTEPGYRVTGVTAVSSGGNIDPIPVTPHDGAHWIKTTDASTFTSNPTFTVTVEEVTGDLRVTSFDDRYADGILDYTHVAKDGNRDELNGRLARVVTSRGVEVLPGTNDKGEYLFEDLPVGETKLYFTHPNASLDSVFFDATDARSADDIATIPNDGLAWSAPAVATVTVDEDGAKLVAGFTALRAVADVEYADGTPAKGVPLVEFGSAGTWYPATEYGVIDNNPLGTYEAFANGYYVRHLPDEIGVRITPPAGYAVGGVTAISGGGNTTSLIPVMGRGGEYFIETVEAASYFSNPTFTITLVEKPTATVEVTYFGDVVLDGVYDAASDSPVTGAEVYLEDADGQWWATTSTDGQYRFSGVAPGRATVYAQIPKTGEAPEIPGVPGLELPEGALALWDASDPETNYRTTERAPVEAISFEDGTLINPDGTTESISVHDVLVGRVDADLAETVVDAPVAARAVDSAQQVLIGAASVFQLAAVIDPTTLAPAEGLESLTFGANAYDARAEEAAPGTGVFTATDEEGELAVFGAAEYSITPTVAEGFEIVEVQAISALTNEILEVTEPSPADEASMSLFATSAEYRVAPEQVGGPVGAVLWAVAVAPVDPGTVPGVQNPGLGLPATDPAPAAAPARQLATTGLELEAWSWMLGATLLIAAGLGIRVFVRRREA